VIKIRRFVGLQVPMRFMSIISVSGQNLSEPNPNSLELYLSFIMATDASRVRYPTHVLKDIY